MRPTAAISILALGLCACTSVGQVPTAKLGSGTLYLPNGAPAGTVVLLAAGTELTVNVAAFGLPAGMHGMHLHAVGSCSGPDFASAGSHLNPHGMQHGTANPQGSHLGDLPNLSIDSHGAGAASARLNDDRAAGETAIFDGDGTALVIHAQPDDSKTDPSGNSGARIACAVLKRG
ncbi:MAG: superoxide dismutase family protein [Novosphingobium sp.]